MGRAYSGDAFAYHLDTSVDLGKSGRITIREDLTGTVSGLSPMPASASGSISIKRLDGLGQVMGDLRIGTLVCKPQLKRADLTGTLFDSRQAVVGTYSGTILLNSGTWTGQYTYKDRPAQPLDLSGLLPFMFEARPKR